MSSGKDTNANLVEQSKRTAAFRAVDEHFKTTYTYVGIGSGSTVQYVVEAIKQAMDKAGNPRILFVPTGYQSRSLVDSAGLTSISIDSLPEDQKLDVAFDGADEVDEDFNCVKGGGACLYQEKLVATSAKEFICVADFRKDSKRLLNTWTYIPIEVDQRGLKTVIRALKALGSPNPEVRASGAEKQGPLKTDQDNFIIKAPFPPLLISKDPQNDAEGVTKDGAKGRVWEVERLAVAIKMITGVLEVGLFVGRNGPEAAKAGDKQGGQKPVAVYFGMEDGTVKARYAEGYSRSA
ncbi:MAG: ribose-5-phosphate isomerase rki1 [Chrysothrix sp. TS-e1954]|nr:MAG: ribose-5-phosphate isomerase rki1 [Chrysothrix sp. TS-e1954]